MLDFFVNQSYTDFDVYNEAVKSWDLEFYQLGRGQFNADILLFGDLELQIGKVKYNKLLLQNGSAPSQGYTFAIHHNKSAPFLWRYQSFEFNSIIVFPENRELHGISQPGHHPLIVTISEELLASVSSALGLPDIEKFILKGTVNCCNPARIKRLQKFLTTLCYKAIETQGESTHFINDAAKWQLSSLLLKCLAELNSVKPKKRNTENRRKVVDRTLEFIHSDLSTSISIEQLCSVAKVDCNQRFTFQPKSS